MIRTPEQTAHIRDVAERLLERAEHMLCIVSIPDLTAFELLAVAAGLAEVDAEAEAALPERGTGPGDGSP